MKTFYQFLNEVDINIIEEFKLLPKEKIDKKLKDITSKGKRQWPATRRIRAVRNHLGKITDTTKKLFDDETDKVNKDIELRNFRTYNKDGVQDDDKWERVVQKPKIYTSNTRSAISSTKGPNSNTFDSIGKIRKKQEKINTRQKEYNQQQHKNKIDIILKRSGGL